MRTMGALSIRYNSSHSTDRVLACAGDSHASSGIDVACPTTQRVFAIASPHELHGSSSPSSSTGTSSFCCNHQYSITAVTTSAGAVTERYAYTAYGLPTILDASASVLSASAISNRYSYTGREWDATLALHHFRARWMSPHAGRFLGRDPIGYVGSEWGLYELLDARSLQNSDPDGLKPCPQADIDKCKAECEKYGDVYFGTSCFRTTFTFLCLTLSHEHKCCYCAFSEAEYPPCVGRRPQGDPCDKTKGKIQFPPIIPAPFDRQIRDAIGARCTKAGRDAIPLKYREIAARWYEDVVVRQIELCRPIEEIPKDCYYRLNQARARFLRGQTDECPGGVRNHCPELQNIQLPDE
jgi:RHS repeat-associated protein